MLTKLLRIGHESGDTKRDRALKSDLAIVLAGFLLMTLEFMVLRERTPIERILDVALLVAICAGLVTLQIGKRVDLAFQVCVAMALPAMAVLLVLNGNREGDFFTLMLIPICAVVLLGPRRSIPWFAACMIVVAAVIGSAPILPEWRSSWHLSPENPAGLLIHAPNNEPLSLGKATSFVIAMSLSYFIVHATHRALVQANARIESLLLNILPAAIARRLSDRDQERIRTQGTGIANEFDQVTILFADIVGFTEMAERLPAPDLMARLDRVFTAFDALADRHGVEKIKTIGDAYMAVCGLPDPNPRHAENIADMALDMIEAIHALRADTGETLRLRVGINTGPVVAGIIGRRKFIYDLWGDAVNTASRMESHGEADSIQVGETTYDALKERYDFAPRGEIDVKGKGRLPVWHLLRKRAAAPDGDKV